MGLLTLFVWSSVSQTVPVFFLFFFFNEKVCPMSQVRSRGLGGDVGAEMGAVWKRLQAPAGLCRTVASCCPTMHRICPLLSCPPPTPPPLGLAQCSEAPYPGPGPMWVRKTCPDSHWIIMRRGSFAFSCPYGCCPLSFAAVRRWISRPSPSPQAGFCCHSTMQAAFWAWSCHFYSLPNVSSGVILVQ